MRRSLLCRLGLHSARLSQGEVGYCMRKGCDYKLDHVSNGRIWVRMVPEKVDVDITKHIGGLPPARPLPPPPPPPPTPGVGNIGRAPAKRVEIHIYHHRD